MDLQFHKDTCQCLDRVVCEVQTGEQTQELRLNEGMPDIGRVLAAWGQPILRSKEWRGTSILVNGGVLIWVLYAPEDGTEARCVDSWLPLQFQLDLPQEYPQGQLRVQLLPRFSDARSISARKLLLRSGVSALIQGYSPREETLWTVREIPQDVQLLRKTYPMRLCREMGEKTFQLDEELILPGSAPAPEKIIYHSLRPEITDQKVMSDKVVFRGNGNLHILYRSEEGQLHSWDFDLPFSQYSSLDASYDESAQADVMLCPTGVELEMNDEGHFYLKCGITAQYLVDNRQMVEAVADGYAPGRTLQLRSQPLSLPVVLETRHETVCPEQLLPASMNLAADLVFLPEHPRIYPMGDCVRMELPGVFQALYYDENGSLQGASGRWQGMKELPAQEEVSVSAIPFPGIQPQMALAEGAVTLRTEFPLAIRSTARQEIPMVTGIELGQEQEQDPMRPSLILRRASAEGLWPMAKECGSTVEAICRANGLEGEPQSGQMLLIPVM